MYNGIENQRALFLKLYASYTNELFLMGFIFILLLCYLYFLFRYLRKENLSCTHYSVSESWEYLKHKIFKNRKIIFTCLFILISFYIFYSSSGFKLAKASAFSTNTLLFELDTRRVIIDMTSFFGDHNRTKVHPIYVLLINPLGCLIADILHNKIMAAVIINSFISSFNVVLAFLFFYLLSNNHINSLLFSFIFGFSMSQFVFGSTPETGSLATLSLMSTYILFFVGVVKNRSNFIFWCLAGILSLGVTVTNFMQTFICFLVISFSLSDRKYLFKNIISYIFIVFGTTGLLSIIQKLIYPSSGYFFLPNSYTPEAVFISFQIIYSPIKTLIELVRHFFVVNFIAPIPNVFNMPSESGFALTFVNSYKYLPTGWLCLILWAFLLTKAFCGRFLLENKIFFIGIISCVLFNLLLHAFYGVNGAGEIEPFPYTGNFTFLVLIFMGYSLISNKSLFVRLLLFAIVLLMAFNNILVMNRILTVL